MAVSRRNSGLKFYVNGQRAKSLHGLVDPLGRLLSAYDTATVRAVSGLKRRGEPAAKRAVRSLYNLKAGDLSGKFRVEEGGSDRNGGFISIWASTRRIPLIAFGGRWSRSNKPGAPGASASIGIGASATYDHAFIAPLRVGGKTGPQIAKRVGPARISSYGRYKGKVRQSVHVLKGPSPYEMISGLDHAGSRGVRDGIVTELRVFYVGELKRQWKLARGGNG